MENIEELLTLCRKWAGRENEVPVIDALTRLTEFYMSQCGAGLGMLSFIHEIGEYWTYKLSLTDHPLSELAGQYPFIALMPFLSKEFADKAGLPIVGEIARSEEITRCEDQGKTVVEGEPDCSVSQSFLKLAKDLLAAEEGGENEEEQEA